MAGRRRSRLRGADRVGGECRVSCGRHRRRGVAVPARRPADRSALARAARGGWPGRGQDAARARWPGQGQDAAAARGGRRAAGRGQPAGQAAGQVRVRRDPGRPGRAGLVRGARARRARGSGGARGSTGSAESCGAGRAGPVRGPRGDAGRAAGTVRAAHGRARGAAGGRPRRGSGPGPVGRVRRRGNPVHVGVPRRGRRRGPAPRADQVPAQRAPDRTAPAAALHPGRSADSRRRPLARAGLRGRVLLRGVLGRRQRRGQPASHRVRPGRAGPLAFGRRRRARRLWRRGADAGLRGRPRRRSRRAGGLRPGQHHRGVVQLSRKLATARDRDEHLVVAPGLLRLAGDRVRPDPVLRRGHLAEHARHGRCWPRR